MRGGGFVGAYPEVEGAGLHGPAVGLGAPEAEVFGVEREGDGAGFVGFERDADETFEFANGAGGAARALVSVELDDFITRAVAGVLHVDGDLKRGAAVDCGGGDVEVGGRERGVA